MADYGANAVMTVQFHVMSMRKLGVDCPNARVAIWWWLEAVDLFSQV